MADNEGYGGDKKVLCTKCGRDLTKDDRDNNTRQFICEECNDIFCTDCCVQFGNLRTIICKPCVDEVYPREEKVVEKVVEKIVEIPKKTIKGMGFSEPIL